MIVHVLETLLDTAPNEQNVELFLNLVQIIERFARISPFSAESCIELLERIHQFATARLAVFSSIFMARRSPEKRLRDLAEEALANCKHVNNILVNET